MMPPYRPVRTRQSGDLSSRPSSDTKGASPSRAHIGARGGRLDEFKDRMDEQRQCQLPTGNDNAHVSRHGCAGASTYASKEHRRSGHPDRRETGPSSTGTTASAPLRSFKSAMFYEYLEPEDELHYHGNYHYSPKQTWGRASAQRPCSGHPPAKRPPTGDRTSSSSSDSCSSTSLSRVPALECPYFLPPVSLPPHGSKAPNTPPPPHTTRGHPNSPSSPLSRRGKGSEVGLWLESAEATPCASPSRRCGSPSSLRQPLPYVPYPPLDDHRQQKQPPQHGHQRDSQYMQGSRTRQGPSWRPSPLELEGEDDQASLASSSDGTLLPAWVKRHVCGASRSMHQLLLWVQSSRFLLLLTLASLLLVVACLLSVVLILPPPPTRSHGSNPPPKQQPYNVHPVPLPGLPASVAITPVVLGAAETGKYPDLLAAVLGVAQADVDNKLHGLWSAVFGAEGDKKTSNHYFHQTELPATAADGAAGHPAAYIMAPGSETITSQGLGYALMACVQGDRRGDFDLLWAWTKHMHTHKEGELQGLHASRVSADGRVVDGEPSPEAEVWIATSLLFAYRRWGLLSASSTYDGDALWLLQTLQDPRRGLFTSKGIVRDQVQGFVSNPSYQHPAFFETWTIFLQERGQERAGFWRRAAKASREYLQTVANEKTGLFPDYADLSGAVVAGDEGHCRGDGWRVAANLAVDWSWWRRDDWVVQEADRLMRFLTTQGVASYGAGYAVDGSPLPSESAAVAISGDDRRPRGVTVANGLAAMASSDDKSRVAFMSSLWRLPVAAAPLPQPSPELSKADPYPNSGRRRLRLIQPASDSAVPASPANGPWLRRESLQVNPVPLPLPSTPPHLPTKPTTTAPPSPSSEEDGSTGHRPPRSAVLVEGDGLAVFDHLFAMLHLAGQFRAYL